MFIPKIPGRYFKPSKAAALFRNGTLNSSRPNTLYIYPGSTLGENCSGTLRGINYCYRARRSDPINRRLFTFMFLSQNGLNFSVSDKIEIRSHDRNSCATRPVICCGSRRIRQQGVTILPSNFSFGIFTGPVQLLSFSNAEEQYHADCSEVQLSTMPQCSKEFVTDSLNDHPLLLMRFFIDSGMFHVLATTV